MSKQKIILVLTLHDPGLYVEGVHCNEKLAQIEGE